MWIRFFRGELRAAAALSNPQVRNGTAWAVLWILSGSVSSPAFETPPLFPAAVATNKIYQVSEFQVRGATRVATNVLDSILQRHKGTNLTELALVRAASEILLENRSRGYPPISIGIAEQQITNGTVTLNLFRGNSEVLVSGRRYPLPRPAERTNPPVHIPVKQYEITGDTLLSTEELTAVLNKYTGTNMTVDDIVKAASSLQSEYQTRGFPTVNVTLPPQQITNGMVKIRVFVGHLSSITVSDNQYFSSNNVLRALPSLRTNQVLNRHVFQAELDRANVNQDRQIYPQLEPGEVEGTTRLNLSVKDRLPLHGKLELNNQSSPGTPDLRIASSLAYNNLWQYEHSIGLQYSFSPQAMKSGEQWNWYDRPLVANYSGFYRLPLGGPESVEETIAAGAGAFGYDESSRRFRLPPPSGRPELSVLAGRSTIDTGVLVLSNRVLDSNPEVILRGQDVQQDLTITENVSARFNAPLRATSTNYQAAASLGLDYKLYSLVSSKTNNFFYTFSSPDQQGRTNITHSEDHSRVPTTHRKLDYLPLSFHYDFSERDSLGVTTFGLGIGANAWYSGSLSNLHSVTGSTKPTGHWFILNPSLSRDFIIRTNWTLSLRAEGQWTEEPLISNEQFGNGGVASVRGYREGEVFGDTGWRVNAELKSPPFVVGDIPHGPRLTVRSSLYMDYGETYLLDPNGRPAAVPLWGTGLGFVASLGTLWDARLLCSFPLLDSTTTSAYQPFFNFSLSGQF